MALTEKYLFLFGVSKNDKLALLSDLDFASGGSAKGLVAVVAGDRGLRVREDDGDRVAIAAADLQKVGVRRRHSPLQLVALLRLRSARCCRGR